MTRHLLNLSTLLLTGLISLNAISLKEVYDAAGGGFGYDKYLELETGVTYTGGLLLGSVLSPITNELEGEEGLDVRIVGNGAILDLGGQELCISYCSNQLVIDDCIVLNGNIRYRGIAAGYDLNPAGSVSYITFYKTHDYGIRLYGAGQNIILERNLAVDATDTGPDFIYTTGIAAEWLPTGANYCISVQYGFYGIPELVDNWSFHSRENVNADSLRHFLHLCEYG